MNWRWLLAASVVFAGLLQWQWALAHSYQHFLWRWAGAAFLVFLFVFFICKLLTRWFGEKVVQRFQIGTLIFSFAPLALFLQSEFATTAGLLLIVSLSLIVLFDLAATRLRIYLSGFVVISLLGLAALNAAVEFDTLTIKWESPDQDTFIAMFGLNGSTVQWGQHSGSFEFVRNGLVVSRVTLTRVEKNSDRLGLRFWTHAGDVAIQEISFDSTVLFWKYPLVKLDGDKLADYLALPGMKVARNGTLINVIPIYKGPRSWVYLQFDSSIRQQLYSTIKAARVRVLRIAWWSVGITVFLLALMLIRSEIGWSRFPRYWRALFAKAEPFDQAGYEMFLAHNRKWIFAGIVLLIVLVFARSWEGLTTDALFMEDAALHFNKYFGGAKSFESIFDRPNGYVAFFTNLQAWLYAKTKIEWQPDLYRYSGFLLAMVAASCLSFSGLFRKPVTLLALPGILGLAGLNHIFFWNTITYQIFTTVVLAICLLFLPPPATRLRLLLRLALIAVLIWSGPYSVIAVGVALLLLLLRVYPGSGWIYLWTVVLGVLYFIAFDGSAVQPLALFNTLHRAPHFFAVLFEKVLLLDLFGEITLAKGLAPLLLISLLLWLLRADRQYIKLSLTIFALMISSLLLYFVTVKYDRFVIQENHILLSYFFWLVFLLLSIDRILVKFRLPGLVSGTVAVVFAFFVWKDNHMHPNKHYWPKMDELPGFIVAVKHFTGVQQSLVREGKYVVVSVPPRWPPLPGPTAVVGKRENSVRLRRQDIEDPALQRFVLP